MSLFPVHRSIRINSLSEGSAGNKNPALSISFCARQTARWFLYLLGLLGLALSACAQTSQIITWHSPSTNLLRLGQAYPLAASASSGLPVTFRVQSGPALIKGSTVTATNGGTLVLAAEQAGNASYAAASQTQIFNQVATFGNRRGIWPETADGFFTRSVQVKDRLAYVADGFAGLQLIDVSDPDHPTRLGGFATADAAVQVQVAGKLAYVAAANAGLLVLDVSNPANPVQVGAYQTNATIMWVNVQGSRAYVAAYDAGLLVIDVSNPAKPVFLGDYRTPSAAVAVQVAGNKAYVGTGGGLQIVDVSNPSKPAYAGQDSGAGAVSRVQVVGQTAYLATLFQSLRILDVSVPQAPLLLGSYFAGQNPQALQVVGTRAYVASQGNGLEIVDVSDPAAPARLGGIEAGVDVTDIQVGNDSVYALENHRGLQVVALHTGIGQELMFNPPPSLLVTNPPRTISLEADASSGLPVTFQVLSGPALVSDTHLTITNHGTVTVRAEQAGDAQFVPVSVDRVIEAARLEQALTFSPPSSCYLTNPVVPLEATAGSGMPVRFRVFVGPGQIAGNLLSGTNAGTVAIVAEADGNQIYAPVSVTRYLDFYKTDQTVTWQSPADLVLALGRPYPLAATASSGLPVSFRVDSGPAFIADGSVVATNLGPVTLVAQQGFDVSLERIVNIPVETPVVGHTQGKTFAGVFSALHVVGNIAYAVGGGLGLQQISLADPANPTPFGNTDPFTSTALDANSNSVYLVGGQYLRIYSSHNGFPPELDLWQFTGSPGYAVQSVDNLLYVASGSKGLVILDTTNPAKPAFVGRFDLNDDGSRPVLGVQVAGHFAYLTESYVGLQIVDVTDPKNPVRVSSFYTGGEARAVRLVGHLAYIANGGQGLRIVDVSDPANPVAIGSFSSKGPVVAVQVVGSRAYLSEGEAGLEILEVTDPAHPIRLGDYDTPGSASDIQLAGNYVCVADGTAGLLILDFGKPLPAQVLVSTPAPPGSGLLLTPLVLGVGPARFQWFRGDQPLAGETNAFLQLAAANAATAGDYRVEINTVLQHGLSEPVTVARPPVVSTHGLPSLGTFKIHVEIDASQAAQSVRLDVSPDLQHWKTLAGGFGSFDFALPAVTVRAQFFRAVVE